MATRKTDSLNGEIELSVGRSDLAAMAEFGTGLPCFDPNRYPAILVTAWKNTSILGVLSYNNFSIR
jgi:hypothetical protein